MHNLPKSQFILDVSKRSLQPNSSADSKYFGANENDYRISGEIQMRREQFESSILSKFPDQNTSPKYNVIPTLVVLTITAIIVIIPIQTPAVTYMQPRW